MNWYLIQTIFNSEFKAKMNLERQNFFIYFPRYIKMIKKTQQYVKVIKPLFPGYVFILMDIKSTNWSVINSTYGVKNIISRGLEPVEVPKKVIEELKMRENREGITNIKPHISNDIGDKIEIHKGVFAGKHGIFDGLTADNRIKILFNFMGKEHNLLLS